MLNISFYCIAYIIIFQAILVLGDTFIETFTGNSIEKYLTEKEENYYDDIESVNLFKTVKVSNCYIFNEKEFKRHNLTDTYALQKVVRKNDNNENVIKEIPVSPRLFPDYPLSKPIYSNVYIVPDIKSSFLTFYDLRLSYSSSTPANFKMHVFSHKKFETFFPNQLASCCKDCQNINMDKALFIMMRVNYDGVSSNEIPVNSLVTPYNIVFEPYILYFIPRNVINLFGFIVILSLFLIFYFIPNVFKYIDHIKQE